MKFKEPVIRKIQSPIGELTTVKGVQRDFMGLREEAAKLGLRPLTLRELDAAVMSEEGMILLRDLLNEGAVWYRSGSMLAYRALGRKFVKRRDVVDSYEDGSGRVLVIPASEIPTEAIGRTGTIFIENILTDTVGNKIGVTASQGSAVYVDNTVRKYGGPGILDPKTGLVIVSNGPIGWGSNERIRWYYKTDEDRVVPPGRYVGFVTPGRADDSFYVRRIVEAGIEPRRASGVVLIGSGAAAPLSSLATAAETEIAELGVADQENLKATIELIKAAKRQKWTK